MMENNKQARHYRSFSPGPTAIPKEVSGNLTCMDFLPNRIATEECCNLDVCDEPFSTLVAQANAWLREHPLAHVSTCQCVDFKLRKSGVMPDVAASTYRTRGDLPNYFVRGLRLWIQSPPTPPKSSSSSPEVANEPEQIDYFNVIPSFEAKKCDGCSTGTEPLDVMVAKFNSRLRTQPIKGRILTVDTISIKYDEDGLYPDRTTWSDRKYSRQNFLLALRVFYLQDTSSFELVTIADFVPGIICSEDSGQSKVGFGRPVVESFTSVFDRVHEWILQLPPNLRLLNIQTLHFRQRWMHTIDTLQTSFCEDNMHSYQIKFLRVVCVVNQSPPPVSTLLSVNCRLFVPSLLDTPGICTAGAIESQGDTRRRIAGWLSRTGRKLISIETLVMRLYSGAENFEGFDAMHTWNRVIHHSNAAHSHRHNFLHGRTHHRHGFRRSESSAASETFVFVYRVYTEEIYPRSREENEHGDLEDYVLSRVHSRCVLL